jgi:hypothetical protein
MIWRSLLAAGLVVVVSGCDPDGELGRGIEGDDAAVGVEEAQQPADPQVTRDTQHVELPRIDGERP